MNRKVTRWNIRTSLSWHQQIIMRCSLAVLTSTKHSDLPAETNQQPTYLQLTMCLLSTRRLHLLSIVSIGYIGSIMHLIYYISMFIITWFKNECVCSSVLLFTFFRLLYTLWRFSACQIMFSYVIKRWKSSQFERFHPQQVQMVNKTPSFKRKLIGKYIKANGYAKNPLMFNFPSF